MAEFVRVSLDKGEVHALKMDALAGRSYASRVSLGMALRLRGFRNDRRDYWPIIDELDHLEGLRPTSGTKPASPFKHELAPFWHKHFSSARHVPRNLANQWSSRSKGWELMQKLETLCTSWVELEHDKSSAALAHLSVVEAYDARAKSNLLTGDWIVFAEWHGQKYYLDVAKHEEGRDAEALLRKLRASSEVEFPFLFT